MLLGRLIPDTWQIKDGFWMRETIFTAYIVALFALLLAGKIVYQRSLPPLHKPMVLRGVVSALCTAVFFVWGLDDLHDPFRMCVGCHLHV